MKKALRAVCSALLSLALTTAPAFAGPATNHATKQFDRDDHQGPINHVFVIVLENEGFDVTFGPNSKAPFLSQTLVSEGVLLNQYYGTGHVSLDNYIAMLSGQAATPQTRNDCQTYADFAQTGLTSDGQSILRALRRFPINSTPSAKPGAPTWKIWATILPASPPPAAIRS
jgi:hypothetical protein